MRCLVIRVFFRVRIWAFLAPLVSDELVIRLKSVFRRASSGAFRLLLISLIIYSTGVEMISLSICLFPLSSITPFFKRWNF